MSRRPEDLEPCLYCGRLGTDSAHYRDHQWLPFHLSCYERRPDVMSTLLAAARERPTPFAYKGQLYMSYADVTAGRPLPPRPRRRDDDDQDYAEAA